MYIVVWACVCPFATSHINVVLEKAANTDLTIGGEVQSKGIILKVH